MSSEDLVPVPADYVAPDGIRLNKNAKNPVEMGWSNRELVPGTEDGDLIDSWLAAGWNVGLRTGRGYIVVDADLYKDGGYRDLGRLAALGVDPENTYCVATPSGGLHIFYRTPTVLRSVRDRGEIPTVEFQGDGSQVVGQDSQIDGVAYEPICQDWVDMAEVPPALLAWWQKRLTPPAAKLRLVSPRASARATPTTLPADHRSLLSAAGRMRRLGFGGDAILAALRAQFEAKDDGRPVTDEELERLAVWVCRFEPEEPILGDDDALDVSWQNTRAVWGGAMPGAAELLDELVAYTQRFVVTSEENLTAFALWVMCSWVADVFHIAPYLNASSPEKGCGKTTLVIDVAGGLVRNPISVVNLTEATLYRMVEELHPTLLIDEYDQLLKKGAEATAGIQAVVNAGYRRGARIPRMGGEDRDKIKFFDPFGMKAFTSIGRLPDTIDDRCITLGLRRARAPERFLNHLEQPALDRLSSRLAAWAEDAMPRIADGYLKINAPLAWTGRQAEVWTPLLTVAEDAGKYDEAVQVAEAVMGQLPPEESDGITLLRACYAAFGAEDRLSTRDLLDRIVDQADRPAEWFGRDLGRVAELEGRHEDKAARQLFSRVASKLSGVLKPFGIEPRTIKLKDGTTAKGYRREDLEAAWSEFGVTAVTAVTGADPRDAVSGGYPPLHPVTPVTSQVDGVTEGVTEPTPTVTSEATSRPPDAPAGDYYRPETCVRCAKYGPNHSGPHIDRWPG